MMLPNPYSSPITLEQLLEIERRAYPETMREMQWAENWEDIADYAEVPLKRLVILSDGESWHAIIALHRRKRAEFIDLAKVPGSLRIDWEYLLEKLREMGIKKVFGDMRGDTSYRRFIEQIERFRTLGVRIIKDISYKRDGERFHEFIITI